MAEYFDALTGSKAVEPPVRISSKTAVDGQSEVYPVDSGLPPLYVMLSETLDSGRFSRRQLEKKYKHAGDFGVNDTKKNTETLIRFRDAIEAHIANKDTVEKGTYRRHKGSVVFFNSVSKNVVILKESGEFLSGWKIDPALEVGRIYLETGVL